MLQNKRFKGISIVFATALFVSSVLIVSSSYFNSKQIQSETSQCYQNNGNVMLEIHNRFTNEFSFECQSKK
ncbi:hypothetical protein CVN76_00925 [Bacillus sp. mrc49]|nr:hypothetical protein CVN76_08255 [Bacillus sp. mrc49]PJN92166.1 hypothetical protein CVN76_00925 [Bacillus sp. mrc49]